MLGTKYSLAENQPASQQPFPVKSRSRFNFVGKGNNQLVSVFVYYFIDSPGETFFNCCRETKRKDLLSSRYREVPAGVKGLTNIRRSRRHCFVMDFCVQVAGGKPSNINYPPVFGTSSQLVVPLRTHAEPNTQNRGVAQLN